MDEVIDIINQLQDVFIVSGHTGIELPQIVVVGTQSSGKSSVLEHIVGKSFLPRGVGIVTRCPLLLQLVNATGKTAKDKGEYAIFQHDKSKVFTDYSLISKEIEEQTARLAGANKGICHTPISLRMFSPSFLNLSLVDLPGLTKVPVGEQPPDIEEQTRNLTMKYIENLNSIILAVTPANVDMATSESLKIAREVDPQGKRTLAVITKLDLMDEGTDAWDMLSGKVIPVKLGIVGVVNRSQKDIQDEKSIAQSLKDEAEFFNNFYKSIASTNGSPYLTKKVQGILINHIKNCMPQLRENIKQKLMARNMELKQIKGNTVNKSSQAQMLELMTKFSSTYVSAIKGKLTNIQTKELYGGARINYVFRESLSTALKSVDALTGLTKVDVITAMMNSSGVNSTIFVPEVAFELLVKKQIERLRTPCLQCVDLIYKELNKMIQDCIEDSNLGLERYPKLQRELDGVVTKLLQDRLPTTNQMVEHFIDVQLAFINTSHPDFLPNTGHSLSPLNSGDQNFSQKADRCLSTTQKKPLTMMGHNDDGYPSLPAHGQQQLDALMLSIPNEDKMNRDYILIKDLLQSYFSLVRKTIQDTVPKIIMHFLVNYVVDHLQLELVARLYKSDAEDLLQESDVITEKRKNLEKEIVALEKASVIINNMSPSVANVRNSLILQKQPYKDII